MRLRIPFSLLTTITVIGALAVFVTLTWLNVIPLESLFFSLLNIILTVVVVALLAAIGGVFLGMILAHRMLVTREFSPVERAMMEAAQDVKTLTARVEKLEATVLARLDELEARKEEPGKIRR